MRMDGGQQQAPGEATDMILVMKTIPEETLAWAQLQRIVGPYLEELADVPPPEKQPAAELAAETEEAEVAPQPGKCLALFLCLLI